MGRVLAGGVPRRRRSGDRFLRLSVDDGFTHRADVDGMGTAWTWCTYDPLFIARVLGATVRSARTARSPGPRSASPSPPDGVDAVEPATAVMSMMPPDLASFDDIITTLCHYIWFFCGRRAARRWTRRTPTRSWCRSRTASRSVAG